MKNENTVIERLTAHFGTAYKASKALNIHSQQYYSWIKSGKIPFKHGKNIELVTGGAIKAIEVWESAL
jgi:DNA-binding transcriptional regulator Cro